MHEPVDVECETRGLEDTEGGWWLGGKGEGGGFGAEGGEEGGVGEEAGEEPGVEAVECANAVSYSFFRGGGGGVREDLRPDEVQIERAFEGGGDVVFSIHGVPRLDDVANVAEVPPWLFWLFARSDSVQGPVERIDVAVQSAPSGGCSRHRWDREPSRYTEHQVRHSAVEIPQVF